MNFRLLSRLSISVLAAAGFMAFASAPSRAEPAEDASATGDGEGIIEFHIEGADNGESLPGVQPRPGETEEELNRRLLESFGDHPYGEPESEEAAERREEKRQRIARQAREELLFELEARALKRSIDEREDEIDPALIPSRRFVELSRTLKTPQLLRDHLEREVQQGELSPYDLLDAERGLFDATRREEFIDPRYGGHGYYGRPLPSRDIVEDLLTYQSYLRAQRYAEYYE